MDKNKKKIRSLRIKKWILIACKYIFMLAPVVVLCIINRAVYFYSYEGWKVSLGCIIASITAVLMVTKESKFLKGITGYIIAFVLAFLLDSVIKDLKYITLCLLIGKALSLIFDYPIQYFSKLLNAYLSGTIHAEVYKNAKQSDLGEDISE